MKSFCTVFLAVLLQLSNAIPLEKADLITDPFIMNGVDAAIGEFPHQLMLQRVSGSTYRNVCSAVLISKYQAFTAAHCVEGYKDTAFRVIAGQHSTLVQEGTQIVNISKAIMHPKFNTDPGTFSNDFAILYFVTPVKLSFTIQPIFWNDNQNLTFTGQSCYLSGWGQTQSSPQATVLQKVLVPIISNTECFRKTADSARIYPGHICAFQHGYGFCFGDKGGPMTCMHKGNRVLAGVASWHYTSDFHCNTRLPSVYARVSHFKDFIAKHLIE